MVAKRKRAPAAATKTGSKDVNKVDALFNAYKKKSQHSEGEDVMGPEGIEQFCKDLKLDPSDRKVLLLAWRFGAGRMGFFTREEFKQGFALLNSNSVAQLKKALPALEAAVAEPAALQELHTWAFRFCLTEPGQRIIDTETAAQMLELVLPGAGFAAPLAEYLRRQGDYKKISMDQWQGFFRFCYNVAEDLSNYEDDPAWPVILDSFVEHLRSKGDSGGSAMDS